MYSSEKCVVTDVASDKLTITANPCLNVMKLKLQLHSNSIMCNSNFEDCIFSPAVLTESAILGILK